MYSVQCVRKSQRPTVILQGKSLGLVTQSASDSLQQPSASIMRGHTSSRWMRGFGSRPSLAADAHNGN